MADKVSGIFLLIFWFNPEFSVCFIYVYTHTYYVTDTLLGNFYVSYSLDLRGVL